MHGTAQANTEVISTTGKIGSALTFNGTNDYVSVPDDPGFSFARTDPYSVCAWVKTSSDSTQTIISKDASPNYTGWSVYIQGDVVRAILANQLISPVNAIVIRSSATVNDGVWHFVTVTYDGSGLASGMKIYVDSGLESTSSLYDTLTGATENTADLKIGRRWFGQYFNGDIDQVKIFNRVLSEEEIEMLYDDASGT